MAESNFDREKVSVLIAENNPGKRLERIELLRTLGYTRITQAADGSAAFHALKRRSIDIILSALKMPQMNGAALLKVVSSDDELLDIPLVFVTDSISKEFVREAGRYGAAGIMIEPLDGQTLDEKIIGVMQSQEDEKSEEINEMFAEAQKLVSEGKLDKALKVFENILAVHEDAEVYANMGYIMSAQGKFEDAMVAFRKAVMINNVHAKAYKSIGEVYIKKGEPDEAENYFQKAGDIFLERDQDNEAEESFNEVLKLNPNTTNVYNSLGILHRKRNNYKEAARMYEAALKIDPTDENIYYNLGRAMLEDKRIDEAKSMFKQALKMKPSFSEAKRMLLSIEVGSR
ncbi:MAG: tetratricopeptide repeat protein [Nitrospinota bacterium]